MEMLNGGLLERLRRCPCGKWFVALRKDSKSCSGLCRQKKYCNKPGYKESRRLYMKDYRQLQKKNLK